MAFTGLNCALGLSASDIPLDRSKQAVFTGLYASGRNTVAFTSPTATKIGTIARCYASADWEYQIIEGGVTGSAKGIIPAAETTDIELKVDQSILFTPIS